MFGSFFLDGSATTELYTLSLHDALPISRWRWFAGTPLCARVFRYSAMVFRVGWTSSGFACAATENTTLRSEEHTSELQSRRDLVCRLLLEKKKKNKLIA